jgi:hypothetical protein
MVRSAYISYCGTIWVLYRLVEAMFVRAFSGQCQTIVEVIPGGCWWSEASAIFPDRSQAMVEATLVALANSYQVISLYRCLTTWGLSCGFVGAFFHLVLWLVFRQKSTGLL